MNGLPFRISEERILSGLNDEQRKAVTTTEGPVLVIAGAGSGKTRVLTHRIAYLIGVKGVFPARILAVTFTNKAANEMKERIISLLSEEPRDLWMGTFHSICVRILRKHADKIGYSRNFVIYDRGDQESLVKQIARDFRDLAERPGSLVNRISRMKTGLSQELDERILRIYERYQQELKRCDAMDFDDLLLKVLELFESHREVRDFYAERFKYIHVDEYQDTNRIQYMLLRHLASHHRNLFVVGDDDQSIYAFRGADIRNILEFERDFPGATVIRLEKNYRSTRKILQAASTLISHNIHRKGKTLWTDNPEGEKIPIYETWDEREEAERVADLIYSSSKPPSDFLVLYRTNAQSRALEEALRKYGIPYTLVGGIKFYERKEIKDLLAYLRVILNPRDDVSLTRIINVPPRGIGKTSLERFQELASRNGLSLYEAFRYSAEIPGLRRTTRSNLEEFLALIDEFREKLGELDAYEILSEVINRTDYMDYISSTGQRWEVESRLENIQELLGSVAEFVSENEDGSLAAYLNSVSLKTEIDDWNPGGAVTLMTVHNAKGLEFPVVIITGLEETVFPHFNSLGSHEEIEEERRLLHVAITRAKEKVYMTFTRRRFMRRERDLRPSRFLKELPQEAVEWMAGKPEEKVPQDDEIKRGDLVFHQIFGKGEVLKVYDGKAKVRFRSVGVKTLVLEYAKLVKL
ncbi:MAG: ATP-dependent DNA helicase PcrA [Candidatus Hydrothermota bacterium]|nr:MAG: ATP-dependent DNA helicase PcrA [Candidatus Hydrothermae bacterium]